MVFACSRAFTHWNVLWDSIRLFTAIVGFLAGLVWIDVVVNVPRRRYASVEGIRLTFVSFMSFLLLSVYDRMSRLGTPPTWRLPVSLLAVLAALGAALAIRRVPTEKKERDFPL